MYKLVALDLDDTLLNTNREISQATRQVLSTAMENGVYVTLATGRMFRSALPFAKDLGIHTPLITYQGALVKHPQNEEVLFHRPVSLDLAVDIVQRIKKYGYHINIYLDDFLYVAEDREEGRRYARLSRIPLEIVGDLEDFMFSSQVDPTKVLVVSEEYLLDELAGELMPVYRDRLHITKSKPHFLEFSHPSGTKGCALHAVADYYGVAQSEVIAVGDSYNDLEMIEWADLGVVMGNAREEIRARADYVTYSNDEEGIEHVFKKFVF
ncbi:MAG: Cof-type HAD-IIB family hydrolase [Clostridiales bacterium]|nr:Cof-type HAD-IIB family hydrolase [Clostridiales bacterium]MCF8023581.1 Cof-type HAD-IIB family hydrolase [Clostridiales bacterium]